MHRKKINISAVLAGHQLESKEVDDGIWLVGFMQYDLDTSTWNNEPSDHRQSVRHETVTHVLGTFCQPCLRAGHG